LQTKIIKIDSNNTHGIKQAANLLSHGGVVAIPTETVYGLAANSLDISAVKSIFVAKGRPQDNPLIVHIGDINLLKDLVEFIPNSAKKLINTFWPGPLTMIFKKSSVIPSDVCAGLSTIAVRMPAHPVALAIIKESGCPIAAPSANISGKPSPTCAQHVISDLYGKIDMIVDSGTVDIGLESTVIDLTVVPYTILRPGAISKAQLEEVLLETVLEQNSCHTQDTPKAPGMKYAHYAPNADVKIVSCENVANMVKTISNLAYKYRQNGSKVGVLCTNQTIDLYNAADVIISMGDRNNVADIGIHLFDKLRQFDSKNVDVILAESVDTNGLGLAIMDRLSKAARFNIINCKHD